MQPAEESLRLHVVAKARFLTVFHPLLQAGVRVETVAGISVKEFLCGELGLTPAYLDTVVQTVFLDGKAVDDLDAAFIRDGSTLALSAAMPGLLGATLRRGSFYAAMRKEISHAAQAQDAASRAGRVKVKIFNLLLEDLARLLLGRGIWIMGAELRSLFQRLEDPFRAGCLQITLNGRSLEPAALRSMEWGESEVFVKVTVDP